MGDFTVEAFGIFVCLSIKAEIHPLYKNLYRVELQTLNSWWIAEQIELSGEIMLCSVRLISFELNHGEVFPTLLWDGTFCFNKMLVKLRAFLQNEHVN